MATAHAYRGGPVCPSVMTESLARQQGGAGNVGGDVYASANLTLSSPVCMVHAFGRALLCLHGRKPMKIQIISTYFEPEHTGNAPYATGLTRHLAEAHDVTVIAGWPHYPEWRVAPEWRKWRR